MLRKRMLRIWLSWLPLGIGCLTSQAATLTVGKPNTPCPNAQYTTITDAVNAAASGDEIDICPALYPEQLLITKPLTLRGITMQGVSRVLLQPAPLTVLGGLPFEAVISVVNTSGVTIENLAIDASNNSISGCDIGLSGVHFYNSSGTVNANAIFGAQLSDPTSCPTLVSYPLRLGGGIGVLVDTDGSQTGPFHVWVGGNSVSAFSANGVLAVGTGVTADIQGNTVAGDGPSVGVKQFAVVLANGAVGQVIGNTINEGTCGALSYDDCVSLRSEGILLRAVGDGTLVDSNSIINAQSGIFINGANNARITNNVIRNIQALDGITIQGTASGFFTNSLISGNMIYNVGPVDDNASVNEEGCGINEYSGTGVGQNTIKGNTVVNAYCGVAVVAVDVLQSGQYNNTLYNVLNSDDYPDVFPPAAEPGQVNAPTGQARSSRVLRRRVE